jgi:RES domain-containing protein
MIWRGTLWRAHDPRWSFAPLSGEGAARHGGRFNPQGVAALYTSVSIGTAVLEMQQGFARKGQPMTLVCYEIDCADVLDLTDPDTLAEQRIARADLVCAWERIFRVERAEPPSWALARRLIGEGIAGIVVPSFAAGATADATNVVFWNWSDATPHCVRAIDDHGRLPRNDLSWREK